MPELSTIYDYMRAHANLLGARILEQFPALHQVQDPPSRESKDYCERRFPHKRSQSWDWPNAGSRRGLQWWSQSAARAKL